MASKRPFSEEDFMCPVCCDIFKDPVLLGCGHSLCRDCTHQYWAAKGSRECPLCRKRSTKNPPVNLALKNLCQTFLDYRGPSEELCEVHRERLSLFCLHDEQLVCVVCRESHEHKTHTCRPACELAEERKRPLRRELSLLTRKMKMIQHAKFEYNQQAEHIRHQALHTANVIKKDFKHLHQLLYDEEKAMLAALNEEKTQKTQLMKDKIETMNDEVLSLSKTIRELTDHLDSGDIHFLQNFKDMMKRAQDMNQDPDPVQGGLIDTAQYLGNLKFTVWSKIRWSFSYSPVVLDPNTANSQLILSEDLTSLRNEDELEEEDVAGVQRKKLPSNLERFDKFPCVLGSVGYSSGTHIWDVDVGDSTFWMLGVTTESVQRKGTTSLPSEVWCIGYDSDTLSLKAPQESCIPLPACEKPKRVRVKLDLDEGQLSFSDPLSNTLYHTFTTNFTEKVFPFFCSLCSFSPLRIVLVVEPCN
ncbi:E3 ubiquitin-protein ligase TRIM35-like [Chanodichthys erythropterus]|uniref:E3 ubiquitin-protein ligase TRIM35-like n=1 Tax=Chanodichthys erythropterus TaxID=933992 RepID=UPI00351EC77F